MVVVTPGPDSVLVLRNTLRGGRRDGVRTACGAAAGSLGWGLGSVAGLTAIAAASAQAYRAVQLAGAGYLLFLGIRNWRVTRAALPDTAAGQINAPITGGTAGRPRDRGRHRDAIPPAPRGGLEPAAYYSLPMRITSGPPAACRIASGRLASAAVTVGEMVNSGPSMK